MTASFKDSFDSYANAQRDYACYFESKGYRAEGDYTVWEPQHEVEGEIEEFYQNNDEPSLGYEEMEEPELIAYSRYCNECACAEF